ncbi:hypothetical protein BKA00_002902 [Actinomadura coerulea]|uniref:Uncharacterized protein n=1 Tax=Actinomadura coerulea TaxID=46159 RepID=A0A7X0KZ15_9ACTN|nr:hypothetical protein [Actinomadura coerulea]MBB6395988.1 hypothetical protein [Actinomadura coerulea]
MKVYLGIPVGSVGKILKGSAVAAALLAAVVAAGCSTRSSSEAPDNGRPPVSATATAEDATPVADPSPTATAEPSAEPSTSQPEATASDVSVLPGKVVGAFEDGPQGPFLVLAPIDEDQGDLEYAVKQPDALRNLDVTALPISKAWKVDVSPEVLRACRPNTVRMVFMEFPSCGGSADAAPSTTDR